LTCVHVLGKKGRRKVKFSIVLFYIIIEEFYWLFYIKYSIVLYIQSYDQLILTTVQVDALWLYISKTNSQSINSSLNPQTIPSQSNSLLSQHRNNLTLKLSINKERPLLNHTHTHTHTHTPCNKLSNWYIWASSKSRKILFQTS
jgi:hypothetical protein